MDKIEIVTNYVKLANFLSKNQLVQANAVTQRMENQLKDDFGDTDPSVHPLFEVYKLIKQTQQQITLGNTSRAVEITNRIRISLQDKQETKEAIKEVKETLGD